MPPIASVSAPEWPDGGSSKISGIIEREAFQTGAPLIVTGAFGHSRVYDFVRGAMTWSLLRNAKWPVRFSK
ncbi:universal stress protein [uncultured Limimaricola sp.]|uniref:universal stress protein n=1 Tax=uncultured Limimaricola sp. TaxID=2211667 RepID=UPI0030FB138F